MLYLVFFILLAIIILILFFIKVYIKLSYEADKQGDHITVSIYALKGLLKITREVGPKGVKGKEENQKDKDIDKTKRGIFEIYDKIVHFRTVYKSVITIKEYIERKVDFEELKIHAAFGTGDACLTGISGGLAWSAAGIIVSFFSSKFGDFKKDIKITPDFSEKKLNLDLHCIFKTKIVYIIVVGLKYLTILLKDKLHKNSKHSKR